MNLNIDSLNLNLRHLPADTARAIPTHLGPALQAALAHRPLAQSPIRHTQLPSLPPIQLTLSPTTTPQQAAQAIAQAIVSSLPSQQPNKQTLV